MAAHNELGKWGEDLATDFLEKKGYEIIERDWKSGHIDLDIIAQEGTTLVVVEVKTRRNRLYGDPEEAVDYKKKVESSVGHQPLRKESSPGPQGSFRHYQHRWNNRLDTRN